MDADGDGSGLSTLSTRLLHGPAIDQVFATENSTNEVLWSLSDHQGTVRDVAKYNSGSDTTSIVDHLKYDSFGKITSQTNDTYQPLNTYTGREWDADSGLFYYRSRWYDSAVGRFIGEDPIGFGAGDSNLARYVSNGPIVATDPSGMEEIDNALLQRFLPQNGAPQISTTSLMVNSLQSSAAASSGQFTGFGGFTSYTPPPSQVVNGSWSTSTWVNTFGPPALLASHPSATNVGCWGLATMFANTGGQAVQSVSGSVGYWQLNDAFQAANQQSHKGNPVTIVAVQSPVPIWPYTGTTIPVNTINISPSSGYPASNANWATLITVTSGKGGVSPTWVFMNNGTSTANQWNFAANQPSATGQQVIHQWPLQPFPGGTNTSFIVVPVGDGVYTDRRK